MTATQAIENKFEQEQKQFSSKSEVDIVRKDMDSMRVELIAKIENSALKTENIIRAEVSNLKSEINKLIVWIIATIFGAAGLFITIAKIFFNK